MFKIKWLTFLLCFLLQMNAAEDRIVIEDVLNIETKLNKRVLAQTHATESVSRSIINYFAGLKNQNAPIGVFLFLGPTGVGKTELAKVLTETIYKNQKYLIRFDMSHFVEPHSLARLIGSPPGYAQHDEGGRLTEAIKVKPQSVILFDEIEKAHSSVRKIFLPVFDEGYLKDAKDQAVSCKDVVFILTSNLCSQQIASLFREGKSEEEILQIIEPKLMEVLSPELYNRVEPVLFRPLGIETMGELVDLMLKETIARVGMTKGIELIVDDSAKQYLVSHGFHATLGARPLKKLIQNTIVAKLSYAIVKDKIEEGSRVTILYDKDWKVLVETQD